MAASRSAGNFTSEFLIGTHRGREIVGDIGWEQFPEKTEASDYVEDPAQVHDDQRLGLLDLTPEQHTLFAHEQPRRNTFARSHLNLHDGGHFGSTTDPWTNPDFDISFHDHDPRGWSDQQPWHEYRRNAEAQFRRLDFKDDGDYSTTGGGIHPNTLYKNIRGTQNWLKARYKNFATEFEGRHSGGVGVYADVSKVFKSEYEDSEVGEMMGGMAATFEDPVNRQRVTMKLSNMVHGGSAFLRSNETTDHKINVAGYGMLYKQRGLTPHESQMRMVEEDTARGRLASGVTNARTKNLVRLMATALEDRGGVSPLSAAQQARAAYQGAAEREEVLAGGMRGQEVERLNRQAAAMTKDIMAVLGYTENEVKWLESRARGNQKGAKKALANLYNMAEMVHSLPPSAKIDLRNELILNSAGRGLRPATAAGLAALSRRAAPSDKPRKIIENPDQVVSYKHIALKGGLSGTSAARAATGTQDFETGVSAEPGKWVRKNAPQTGVDINEHLRKTALEMEFGENKAFKRYGGPIGTKYMRRFMDSDHNPHDFVNELTNDN